MNKRGENRRAAQAVGEAAGGGPLRQPVRREGDDEAKPVAEIVTGVSQQRHRVANEAVQGFDRREPEVQRDPDRKGAAEICWRMGVMTEHAVRVIIAMGMRVPIGGMMVRVVVPTGAVMMRVLGRHRRQSIAP